MNSFPSPGKMLMGLGLVIFVVGALWHFGGKFLPLGKLPGDFSVEKENFKFYFPLATSILLSVALSAIFYLIRFFNR